MVNEKNLILSILGKREEKIANDIYYLTIFHIVTTFEMSYESNTLLRTLYNEQEIFELIKKKIKAIDNGIEDMKIDKETNDYKSEVYKLKTLHKVKQGEPKEVNFDIESDGTKKLIVLYYRIYIALNFRWYFND
jgi:hypothetical protein